jgi:hypothetical protein
LFFLCVVVEGSNFAKAFLVDFGWARRNGSGVAASSDCGPIGLNGELSQLVGIDEGQVIVDRLPEGSALYTKVMEAFADVRGKHSHLDGEAAQVLHVRGLLQRQETLHPASRRSVRRPPGAAAVLAGWKAG